MSYTPTLSLSLAETTLTFANNNMHWCYAVVTIDTGGNTAVIMASEAHIDPLDYWESDSKIYYKLGHFSAVVDGKREAHIIWGNSRTPTAIVSYIKPIEVTGLTLLSTGWTLVSGFYEYDLADTNITATSEVEVIFMKSTIAIVKAADVMPDNLSDTGTVKIYATNEPTDDINVTLIITEVTV